MLESFTTGRDPGRNLDRLVVTEGFVAVLDGATPKGAHVREATAATVAMMDDLASAIRAMAPGADVATVLETLTAAARPHRHPHAPSAAGAVYSDHLRAVVVVSDVWVAVDDAPTFFGHELERALATVRVAFTRRELARGRTVAELRREDPGRAAVVDLLEAERELRNVDAPGDCFFAAIDGEPIPPRLVTVVPVPLGARRLVLASDGYPVLRPTLDQTEAELARVVTEDPLMITLAPGTKAVGPGRSAYDDRTFVSVDVTSSRPGPGAGVHDVD